MKVASTARSQQPQAQSIARCAVRALYAEVALEPKPGLVSFRDNGSHTDMSANTFFKSLFALRHYFGDVAAAGQQDVPFDTLQALGLDAEVRMLRATSGVNTHRGAIFSLGLLCAAAGRLHAQSVPFHPVNLRSVLLDHWGDALRQRALAATQKAPTSNGQRAAQSFALRSANDEAAEGFPTLFEVTLPALQAAIAQGHPLRSAKVHALFCTMAHLDDTNVVHRGGLEGMQFVKARAAQFIACGSVAQRDWLAQARRIHDAFVARRLSPGGAADLIACACWVHEMQDLDLQKRIPIATGRERVHG